MRTAGILSLIALLSACAQPSAVASPSASAPTAAPTQTPAVPVDVAASGRLRVALLTIDTSYFAKNATTGEFTGVSVDVGREFARRLGVSLVVVEVASYPAMLSAIKAGTSDMGIVASLAGRDADLDFTPGFVEADLTYLVPATVAIKTVADADKPGVRIIVRRGIPVDDALSRSVKQAQIVRVDGSLDDAFAALRAGNGDILAAARPNLLTLLPRLPGSVVLADSFPGTQQALAIPKGKADLLRAAEQFVKELRASDLVRQSIARAGVQGIKPVAP